MSATHRLQVRYTVDLFHLYIHTHICIDIYPSISEANFLVISGISKARFKRRTLHVPNPMQMRKVYCFRLFALDSTHVKFDVWNGPKVSDSLSACALTFTCDFFHSYFPGDTKTCFLASYKLRFFPNVNLIGRMGELEIRVIIHTNGKWLRYSIGPIILQKKCL